MAFHAAWLPEHDAALRLHFLAGMSCSQIAAAINKEFHFTTEFTRNAVIGRGHRLGLTDADKPRAMANRRLGKPRKPAAPRITRARQFAPGPEPFVPAAADIVPLHMALSDLRAGHCRYPYGTSAPYTFCGHPVHGESSYCPAHRLLTRKVPS